MNTPVMFRLKRVHVKGLATIFHTTTREGSDKTTATIHRDRVSNIRDFVFLLCFSFCLSELKVNDVKNDDFNKTRGLELASSIKIRIVICKG